MTGIPDAVVEAAARAIHYEYPETGHTWPCDACMSDARAALEAAEGPWREHLATQIEADDIEKLGDLDQYDDRIYYDGKYRAAAIVRDAR